MTLPDYPDWAQPVAQIEQVDTLVTVDTPLDNGNPLADVDTSEWDTLTVLIDLNGDSAGQRFALAAQWLESWGVAQQDLLTFHSTQSYGGLVLQLFWQVPVRGSSLRLTGWGPAVFMPDITVLSSTRTVPTPSLSTDQGQGSRLRLSTGNVVIPAGNNSPTFYIPPVSRAVSLAYSGLAAGVSIRIDGIHNNGGVPAATALARVPFGTTSGVVNPLEIPDTGMELVIVNGSAATQTVQVQVWDVS